MKLGFHHLAKRLSLLTNTLINCFQRHCSVPGVLQVLRYSNEQTCKCRRPMVTACTHARTCVHACTCVCCLVLLILADSRITLGHGPLGIPVKGCLLRIINVGRPILITGGTIPGTEDHELYEVENALGTLTCPHSRLSFP